jgi:Ca2+-binding RTX toxin-like protein
VEKLTLTGTSAINGTGNTLDNYLTGNSAANTLTGGAGNDTLNGGTGADKLIGGTGNDTYIVDNTGDVITENAGEGTDIVQSSVTYTLGNNIENLTLTGTSAINGTGNTLDNYLTGNSAVNTLTGSAGNDTLDGGAGADKLTGGTGNDTYIVDNTGDVVTENANEGIDTVISSVTYTLPANVEKLILTGNNPINGTGNTLDNIITGNSAVNTLTGNNGNDTLSGGLGNDILTGGNGSDTYLFGNSDGRDTINETAGVSGDIDTLKLTGASTATPVIVKQGNDLYVFTDANDYVKIAGEFQTTNYGVERLEVSDGHYITRQDIQTIVDTMSSINNNSGMDVMQKYTAMMNDQQYHNILAASWHQG